MSATPGPWYVTIPDTFSSDGQPLVSIRIGDVEITPALFKAAPDLLAVCKIAQPLLADYVQGRPEVAEQMEQAIKKAKGVE